MNRTSVNFHKQAEVALNELSAATGLPVAEMVRRAIDDYIAKEYQKIGKDIPYFKKVKEAL